MKSLICIAIALMVNGNFANAADVTGMASPNAVNAATSFMNEFPRFRSTLPLHFDVDAVSKCGAVYTFVAEQQAKGNFPNEDETNTQWALMLESYKFMRNFFVFKGMPADIFTSTADKYAQTLATDPSQQEPLITDCMDRLVAAISTAKE